MTRSLAAFTLTMLFSAALAAQTPAPAPAATSATPEPPPGPATGDPAKGRALTRMCEGCHGIEGWRIAYPEVYHVPKIGGQHAKYLAQALHEYKNGDRSNPSMRAIAGSLSDDDIENLAAFYAQGIPQTKSASQ
jgi:cytochrome c553